tara:strand:+ start:28345 stop:28521 length:177 start_codon:yes stop_codon:yes gene_type:complete
MVVRIFGCKSISPYLHPAAGYDPPPQSAGYFPAIQYCALALPFDKRVPAFTTKKAVNV